MAEVPETQPERLSTQECLQRNVGLLDRVVKTFNRKASPEERLTDFFLCLPDHPRLVMFDAGEYGVPELAMAIKLGIDEPIPYGVRSAVLDLVKLAKGQTITEDDVTKFDNGERDGNRVDHVAHNINPFVNEAKQNSGISSISSGNTISELLLAIEERVEYDEQHGCKYYHALLYSKEKPETTMPASLVEAAERIIKAAEEDE